MSSTSRPRKTRWIRWSKRLVLQFGCWYQRSGALGVLLHISVCTTIPEKPQISTLVLNFTLQKAHSIFFVLFLFCFVLNCITISVVLDFLMLLRIQWALANREIGGSLSKTKYCFPLNMKYPKTLCLRESLSQIGSLTANKRHCF